MRTLSLALVLLLTSVAFGEKKVAESRYIEYQSKYAIVEILFQLGNGLAEDTQLLTSLLDTKSADPEEIIKLAISVLRTFRMDIDGKECNCSFRTLVDVYKHIKGYVLDNKNDGSITYSYSITYDGIEVRRETDITNNNVVLITRLSGKMSETVERGVTVDLIYAELTINAKQDNDGTLIRSTLVATTTVNSGCLKERIAANRVVPRIMGDLICGELHRLQDIAVEMAEAGRGHFAMVLDSFIKKVSKRGLR